MIYYCYDNNIMIITLLLLQVAHHDIVLLGGGLPMEDPLVIMTIPHTAQCHDIVIVIVMTLC